MAEPSPKVTTVPDADVSQKKFINIFHNPYTAWVVLGCSVLLTVAAYKISSDFVSARARDRFEFRISQLTSDIKDRMRIYEQVLWGGVALFDTAGRLINRQEWHAYVKKLNIDEHWPGIQGIGFSVPVRAEEKSAHIESVRAEGFEDFTIKPEGERNEYSSIIYLEPFDWRNQRAFGYDMWSEDNRREAMTRARDTGEAATSGIITLVQETEEDVQHGFLTYLPVYKKGASIQTVEERQKAFIGWVYSPFRAGDLMKGILGDNDPDIEFEIYDSQTIAEDTLLYDSNQSHHLNPTLPHSPDYAKTVQLMLQGRSWTVYVHTPPDYLSGAEASQPRIVAIGGVLIDILLFFVIWSVYHLQRRATSLARQMTAGLEASMEKEKKLSAAAATTAEATADTERKRAFELDKKTKRLQRFQDLTVGREKDMIALKKEVNELLHKQGQPKKYESCDEKYKK